MPPKAAKKIQAASALLDERAQVILHRVAVVDGRRVPHDVWAFGRASEVAPERLAGQGLDAIDLARPGPRLENRFVRRGEDSFEAWFYDDAALLGRAVVRSGARSPARRRRLKALLRDALTELCVARVVAEPAGTLVVAPGGVIEAADRDAQRCLTLGTGLREIVASVVREARDESLYIVGALSLHLRPLWGAQPGWLVQLGATQPVVLAPDAVLSPAQREVAEYAAVGATIDEIARSLDAGRETVRSHMKEIYRRLNVANRVELVRALS